jgi:hypothetical protein
MKQKDINNTKTSHTQMRKVLSFLILGIFLFSFAPLVSASLDNYAKVKQGDCINISQTCASCSYVNISSISNRENSSLILNQPMINIGNGEWRYNFCYTEFLGRYDVKGQGDINGVGEGFATYFITSINGEDDVEDKGLAFVFVGIFFIILFIAIIYLRKTFDEEKWYSKMQRQYEDRNFIKLVFSGIGYSFLKNMFVIYYSLGFIILNLVADVSFTYNISSIYSVMKSLVFLYAWGFTLVGILFLSKVQEWIMYYIDALKEKEWGGYS